MEKINLKTFWDMIAGGTKSIAAEYQYINELNIFPVPDGDTGTNLKMTTSGTWNAFQEDNTCFNDLKELNDAFSKKILFNARGNSGVIFSQIVNGFLSNFEPGETEIEIAKIKKSFLSAKEWGYKAVYNPIEGTILTVIREIADNIQDKEYDTIEQLFNDVIEFGTKALDSTKEILEELKRANVVDSGGYGLMSFLKGMNAVLNNKLDDYLKKLKTTSGKVIEENSNFQAKVIHEDIEFGYCSEFILEINANIDPNKPTVKKKFNMQKFRHELQKIGNSIVLFRQDNLVKLHIHTTRPYRVLELGQKYGEFSTIKFENMTNQFLSKINKQIIDPKTLTNNIALIYTVPTHNLAEWTVNFYNQTNYIISEPAAPSVENFLQKIKITNAKNVILLVHDSNLVLAAKSAIESVKNKINVEIIITHNFLDTFFGIEGFDPDVDIKTNVQNIRKALTSANSVSITKAAKDFETEDGIKIQKFDHFYILKKKIAGTAKNNPEIIDNVMEQLIKLRPDCSVCYIIAGKDVSRKYAEKFGDIILEKYGIFSEVYKGDQDTYEFYIGVK